jgi:hypothetical protein
MSSSRGISKGHLLDEYVGYEVGAATELLVMEPGRARSRREIVICGTARAPELPSPRLVA